MADVRRIGVDLGGTKIEAIVLDEAGEIVVRERIATESDAGYEHVVGRVASLVKSVAAQAPDCRQVGIGTPGAISSVTGKMKNSNTQCLNGRDLRADLAAAIGMPVRMANDANCFALAEARQGAGRGHHVVFGVIMGTGVGGGIAVGGRILEGPQRIAGEWGHHAISPSGPTCYCGQSGCVESLISGPAVERAYLERSGAGCDMAEIVRRARAGEVTAELLFDEFLDRFGRALANVISILDPDAVVLGGGLSNIDELYTRGRGAGGALRLQ